MNGRFWPSLGEDPSVELVISTDKRAIERYFSERTILRLDRCFESLQIQKIDDSLGSLSKGKFGKREFIYKPEDDEYECPAGERLQWRLKSVEKGQTLARSNAART